jgi:hypothetical protein
MNSDYAWTANGVFAILPAMKVVATTNRGPPGHRTPVQSSGLVSSLGLRVSGSGIRDISVIRGLTEIRNEPMPTTKTQRARRLMRAKMESVEPGPYFANESIPSLGCSLCFCGSLGTAEGGGSNLIRLNPIQSFLKRHDL